jgi:hypothetical protein
MEEQKVKITIKENGELFIETKGLHGPAGIEEINKMLEGIALAVDISKKTDHHHMKGTVNTSQNIKLGLR